MLTSEGGSAGPIGARPGSGDEPGSPRLPDPVTPPDGEVVPEARDFVSRGGVKLASALNRFRLDVAGRRCVDLGASVGGFTDCLLRHGAASVVAVDTAYGVLDYRLRTDPRVTVIERTNALHLDAERPELAGAGIDLAVLDLGWTPLRLAAPVARSLLAAAGPRGSIVALVKPHYEQSDWAHRHGERSRATPKLSDEQAEAVARRTLSDLVVDGGVTVRAWTRSPLRGGGKRRGRGGSVGGGNVEYLAWLAPTWEDER